MRILLIMDPGIPIPPPLYGGHERLVYMFAEEYKKMGHEVSLLAGPNSKISGKSFSFGVNNLKRSKWQKFKELFSVWIFLFSKRNDFDLVHNFGRLAYLLPLLNFSIKKIMTYGRQVDPKNIYWLNKFPNKNLKFTAPSYDCISTAKNIGDWTRIYNSVDFSKYQFKNSPGKNAPLIFLSRLDRVKGCHIAIEVARATNNKLIIAGNISDIESEIDYFNKDIKPFIDGEKIQYVGAVNDEQKNYYLGLSKAMLFPIHIREAFGMVMAESMACGTPVIGFDYGAIREVIIDSVNGFVVKDKVKMIEALDKIDEIDRARCRNNAENRFDIGIVAKQYLTLFNIDQN
jgi:glycosyltransferase involved in cell wall biosynthesis